MKKKDKQNNILNKEEFLEIKRKINLRTLYPYTNEKLETIELILNDDDYCGVLIPVCVDTSEKEFRILKQEQYGCNGFSDVGEYLINYLECLDLKNKNIFLSIVDLFDDLGGSNSINQELQNLKLLKEAIYRIYDEETNIIVNNSIYDRKKIRTDFLLELTSEFPGLECAYTMYSKQDDVNNYKNVVPHPGSYHNMVVYINNGKRIFLPNFENRSIYRKGQFEELLGYSFDIDRRNPMPCFKEDDNRFNMYYKDADITVISKENADKILMKVME